MSCSFAFGKKPRLHLLLESYFQERDVVRFGISILQQRGIEVKVWEVFRPFRRRYAQEHVPPDRAPVDYVRHFDSKDEILAALNALNPQDTVLVAPGHRWDTRFIYRSLRRRGCRFGTMVLSYFKVELPPISRLTASWRTWRERLYARIPHRLKGTSDPSFILLCGGMVLEPLAQSLPNTTALWSHALDYDIARELKREPSKLGTNIVFLDEYVPFHPDYELLKIQAPDAAESYYSGLCALFRRLEAMSGLKVVVAAHPRAAYGANCRWFDGRQVVSGQTCRLVRDARFVVTHASTSNNFSIIFRKPVMVVTNDRLNRSYYGPYIHATARAFGVDVINMDHEAGLAQMRLPAVNEAAYAHLYNYYVKRANSPELGTWDGFSSYILKDFLEIAGLS